MRWRPFAVLGLMLGLSLAAVPSVAADESRVEAERAHRASREVSLPVAERIQWLEQSLAAWPTFVAHYDLGQLLRDTDANAALTNFHAAFGLANDDIHRGRAAYQLGLTHAQLDDAVEARHWLRRSLQLLDHPEIRRALRTLELSQRGRVVSAEDIDRELRASRAFGVAKAELRVNFQINRARLDPTGRRQADELGKALGQRRNADFVLLGHTDRQCPHEATADDCDRFNLRLSAERAAAVRQHLLETFGIPAQGLHSLGCGRGHLLSVQDSDDDHYLNRRVVILAADPHTPSDELCSLGAGLF